MVCDPGRFGSGPPRRVRIGRGNGGALEALWSVKIRYTARAHNDLEDIRSYIAEKNPQAATRVRQAILAIASHPHVGIRNARSPDLRARLVSRYPYRVHYSVSAGEILILHIRHTSRRPLDWSP
jgi:toxin ParE1/3/4